MIASESFVDNEWMKFRMRKNTLLIPDRTTAEKRTESDRGSAECS